MKISKICFASHYLDNLNWFFTKATVLTSRICFFHRGIVNLRTKSFCKNYIVVNHNFEAWAFRKAYRGLFVFQNDCLWTIWGTFRTVCMSNNKLYKKCVSAQLSRVIMKERLKWLGNVLRMEDYRLLLVAHLRPNKNQLTAEWARRVYK